MLHQVNRVSQQTQCLRRATGFCDNRSPKQRKLSVEFLWMECYWWCRASASQVLSETVSAAYANLDSSADSASGRPELA